MTIEIRPEDHTLIQKRIQSGEFPNADEVIHDALACQDAEMEWLDDNREAIDE